MDTQRQVSWEFINTERHVVPRYLRIAGEIVLLLTVNSDLVWIELGARPA